jgi:hypothetical protein
MHQNAQSVCTRIRRKIDGFCRAMKKVLSVRASLGRRNRSARVSLL